MPKLQYKFGPIEFEVEGDSDLIERERSQFFNLLPQAIIAVSPVVPSQSLLESKPEDKEILTVDAPPIAEASTCLNINQSIAGFLNEKKFSNWVEKVMGVAYYIVYIERNDTFTRKDIETKLDESHKGKPKNISDMISANIKKGFIQESKEKKDSNKIYCILEGGKLWCESYTAAVTDKKQKTTRVKSQKAHINSALLTFSLDELNINNYCDVTEIKKFNECMLVIMLIYTKEKGIEYFTYNDIISALKNKFNIRVTKRMVQYAFDTSSTLFDKKVEKKIASYKLLSSGIKEAERIVMQNRLKETQVD